MSHSPARAAWFAAMLSAALPASAHHSFAVFDISRTLTFTGVVKDYKYTNPHCWIDVLVTNPDGSVDSWGFEGGPPSMMRNMGWHYNTLKPGDKITVTTHPHRDGQKEGSIMSLVLPNGVVMGAAAGASRSGSIEMKLKSLVGLVVALIASTAAATTPDFTGVWQVAGSHPQLKPVSGQVPFTEDAAAAYAKTSAAAKQHDLSWDSAEVCIPPGIPRTLAVRQPFEILQEPNVVTFLFQIQRLYRYVYLDATQPVNDDPTFMGQPFGHWDGATLVFTTDNVKTGTFLDDYGMPHSEDLKITERLSLKGRNTLVDQIHIDDDKEFTAPWDAVLTFRRQNGVQIKEDICVDREKK